MVQAGPMLRQLLVGTTVSVSNIVIHTLSGADIVANCAREANCAAIAAIDHRHELRLRRWCGHWAYAIVDAAPADADPDISLS
jgi:hypothetical protein